MHSCTQRMFVGSNTEEVGSGCIGLEVASRTIEIGY